MKTRSTRRARTIRRTRRTLKLLLMTDRDGRIETRSTIAIMENGYRTKDATDFCSNL